MQFVSPEHFPQARHLGDFEPDSAEWHEARRMSIGGSEIGTIMGLNQWESAYALWAKKLGLIPDSFQDNWATRLGKAFEEPILELFGQEHPELEIYRAGTFREAYDYPYLHANPDAIAMDKSSGEFIIVEVKTARYAWDSVPPQYEAQVQQYMYVMGLEKAIIVAVAGMEWNEYIIERDDFQIAAQLMQAKSFYECLEFEMKPDWDGSEHTYQAVRQQHPQIDDTEVDLQTLGLQLLNAQAMAEEATENLTRLKSMVLDNMGYAKTGFIVQDGQKRKVTSRQSRRDGIPFLVIHK